MPPIAYGTGRQIHSRPCSSRTEPCRNAGTSELGKKTTTTHTPSTHVFFRGRRHMLMARSPAAHIIKSLHVYHTWVYTHNTTQHSTTRRHGTASQSSVHCLMCPAGALRACELVHVLCEHVEEDGIVVAQVARTVPQVEVLLVVEFRDRHAVVIEARVLQHLNESTRKHAKSQIERERKLLKNVGYKKRVTSVVKVQLCLSAQQTSKIASKELFVKKNGLLIHTRIPGDMKHEQC